MGNTTHRVGENGLLPFRRKRVFNIGTQWYFAVRDGNDCGPFETMQEAQMELNLYLSELKDDSDMELLIEY